jgi:A/G-specific adenine glycosylase
VWLSEIMLQQTRVEAVKRYYVRFLEHLPTITDLANCDDDLLHKLWEGLGYYNRARNLKKAAQVIQTEYNGVFPREYSQVRALPGIGDYTAGAICSICFDMPVAAVDGNVMRLLSRLCDDATPIDLPARKQEVKRQLEQLYPSQAGDFTQGLMELGATQCGPNREPQCEDCPCKDFCLGHRRDTAAQLPVKLPKKTKRKEDRTVFILSCDGSYALCKRPDKGLLAGLWEFPNVDGSLSLSQALNWVTIQGLKPREVLRQVEREHIFTHIHWKMTGFYLEVQEKSGDFVWYTQRQIREQAALPTAFRQFWKEIDNV